MYYDCIEQKEVDGRIYLLCYHEDRLDKIYCPERQTVAYLFDDGSVGIHDDEFWFADHTWKYQGGDKSLDKLLHILRNGDIPLEEKLKVEKSGQLELFPGWDTAYENSDRIYLKYPDMWETYQEYYREDRVEFRKELEKELLEFCSSKKK